MNFRNLAQIETDFSEILHTTAVFNAEQDGNHADQKSSQSISKKLKSLTKITKNLNFAKIEAPEAENGRITILFGAETADYGKKHKFNKF